MIAICSHVRADSADEHDVQPSAPTEYTISGIATLSQRLGVG